MLCSTLYVNKKKKYNYEIKDQIFITSRSPSPDRRKSNNCKTKSRNAVRRKAKLESYDADLSMDSLNSIVPLRIDKNGKINIEDCRRQNRAEEARGEVNRAKCSDNDNPNVWCGREILSKLSSLKSVSDEPRARYINNNYNYQYREYIDTSKGTRNFVFLGILLESKNYTMN